MCFIVAFCGDFSLQNSYVFIFKVIEFFYWSSHSRFFLLEIRNQHLCMNTFLLSSELQSCGFPQSFHLFELCCSCIDCKSAFRNCFVFWVHYETSQCHFCFESSQIEKGFLFCFQNFENFEKFVKIEKIFFLKFFLGQIFLQSSKFS